MSEFIFEGKGFENRCMICGDRKVYRFKVLDPLNRQAEICMGCLTKKVCEQVKGGVCESKGLMPEKKPDKPVVPVSEVKPAETA